MRIAKKWWVGLLGLVMLTGGLTAAAQRLDGDLSGEVKDSQGLLVAHAKVTIINQATGAKREVETTEAGTFFAANLLPGLYTVQVEQSGFRKLVKPGIEVIANRLAEVHLSLEVGTVTQTVTVEAGAQLVDTQTATLGSTYTDAQLRSPIIAQGGLTGNVINLAILAPGTTTQPGGVAGTGGAIGGNRPRNNSFTVDGLDNNNSSVTGESAPVIGEAVKEFTLLTNQFSAEYGHSTAGQFIITTKTGTNEIHGEGWWYNQNRHFNSLDNLSAAAFQGQDPPRFDANRLGGQVGGRILKDKWFYFGSYEFRNVGQAGTSSGIISVPTQAGLATLQSLASTAGSGVSPVNVKILTDHVPTAASAVGAPVKVCNEVSNPTCDPVGAFVSVPIGQFTGSTPQFLVTHLFLISQDYQTARHKISGRFHYSRQRSIDSGALPVAEFNSPRIFDTRRLTISDAFAVNSRVVNEFRVGYLRVIGPNLPVGDIPPPKGTDVFGNYSVSELGLGIGPQSNFPQDSSANTYQAADNITYVRGKHTLKGGVDVRDILRGGGFLPRARGDFIWATNPTGGTTAGARNLSGLDGFVRDTFPSNVGIRGVGSGSFSQNRLAAYTFFQDSWRIHPRVTAELGVRYEFTQPARDNRLQDLNGLANVASIRGETYTPQLLVALKRCASVTTCTSPQLGTKIFDSLSPAHQQIILNFVGESLLFHRPTADTNNIAPRIGIAWDVFGTGRTSVRAGAARGFDVLFGNLALLQLPPQIQAENRETNACSLSPSPTWCAKATGGNPLAPTSDIRFNTIGFLAGGGLLPVLPLTTLTDPIVARQATGNFVTNEKAPETWTWSLSVEQQFWKDWVVEARYVGTRGLFLPMQRQLNTGIPVYFQGLQLPVFARQSDVPDSFPASALTLAGFDAARSTGTSSPRILSPYGFGGALTEFTYDGISSYHGGSLRVERRFSKGLLIQSSYTYSRTIDSGENELFTSFLNPRRLFNQTAVNSSRGLSGIHRKQKFAFTWVYELPKYRGSFALARGFLNGWSWAGSYLAESGQPVTIQAFRDINGDADSAGDFAFHNVSGVPNTGADSTAVCRAGAGATVPVGTAVVGCSLTTLGLPPKSNTAPFVVGYVSQLDNAEWIRPGRGGMANGGRGNHLMGGINNWNIAITKQTPVWGESRYLEFSAEFVNAFNHPSYTIGVGSVFGFNTAAQNNTGYIIPGPASTGFLQDNTFSGGLGQAPYQRVIQFSLRFVF